MEPFFEYFGADWALPVPALGLGLVEVNLGSYDVPRVVIIVFRIVLCVLVIFFTWFWLNLLVSEALLEGRFLGGHSGLVVVDVNVHGEALVLGEATGALGALVRRVRPVRLQLVFLQRVYGPEVEAANQALARFYIQVDQHVVTEIIIVKENELEIASSI